MNCGSKGNYRGEPPSSFTRGSGLGTPQVAGGGESLQGLCHPPCWHRLGQDLRRGPGCSEHLSRAMGGPGCSEHLPKPQLQFRGVKATDTVSGTAAVVGGCDFFTMVTSLRGVLGRLCSLHCSL